MPGRDAVTAGRRRPALPRAAHSSAEAERQVRFLRALIEHSADMVSVVGADGTLRFHYPPTVLGYAEGENFGRAVFDFVHPDDRDAAVARFAAALAEPGLSDPFECRVLRADGEWRWMELRATNLIDDPTVQGLVLNARDVSERKVAEQSLRANEERFRLLVQHASDLVVVWDAEGKLTYASPAAYRFSLGDDPPAKPDLQSIVTVTHPDDRARVNDIGRQLTWGGSKHERFVARFQRYDGTYRWLDVTLTNLLDNPGVGGVVANAHDITEQIESEEALRHNEQRFTALVEHSTDILAVIDEIGILTYHSPATERLLGYPTGALIGTNAFDLIHEEDLAGSLAVLAQVLEEPDTPRFHELRFRHGDGSYVDLGVAATNRLEDPAVEGIVINARDITERRRAEQAQRASEAWFRSLVQHGYDCVAVLGPDRHLTYVSPAVTNVLGYDPTDLAGRETGALAHPDDEVMLHSHFEAVVATPGAHAPIELRARHADGSWRWLELAFTNQLDNPVVNGVVVNFREITERKRIEGELAHQALHDSLTGLPNRVLLVDRIGQALARAARGSARAGVLFLDLDRFKLVNDTRGHAAGDEVLVAAARRLRESARGSDTVARFGGDEFVVLYDDVTDAADLLARARALCTAMAVPFRLRNSDTYISVSIGAALGTRGESPDAILRDADAAMYHAKERGGGTVALVNEDIRRRAHARFETERSLHGALRRDEFALVYQPVVALDTRDVVGVEALLRWDHPSRGRLAPGDFIDLAEETGQILAIGTQTLERACEQLVAWRAHPPLADLGVSVNVSALQLRDAELPEHVSRALERVSLPASALTLEITESFVIEDSQGSIETLAALKALGVQLVVDDFGTGYSSLGYLHRMPLDGLKVDRTFLREIAKGGRDVAIVAAIFAMAGALGLTVVAEGVETEAQHDQLLELGCRYAQGFLYARPLLPDAIPALADAGRMVPPGPSS